MDENEESTIESPAKNAKIPQVSSVSVSGKTYDVGLNWTCIIQDSGEQESQVSGSSTCVSTENRWSGTVSPPSGGTTNSWYPGAARAEFQIDGSMEEEQDFEFTKGS